MRVLILLIFGLLGNTSQAIPIVVDFDSAPPGDFSGTYSEGGFLFNPVLPTGFFGDPGGLQIFGVTDITRPDGLLFAIDSIDIGFHLRAENTWRIVANPPGGTAVNFSGARIMNTSTSGFAVFGVETSKIRIELAAVVTPIDYLVIKNVNLSFDPPPPTNGIPEPTTLALMALGLVGIGYSRRKKT